MFTESEVRLLSREHAAYGLSAMPYVGEETLKTNKERSLRTIQRVLETRAKKLGSAFVRETAARTDDLAAQVQGSKLF
jgi:hypothetical protein